MSDFVVGVLAGFVGGLLTAGAVAALTWLLFRLTTGRHFLSRVWIAELPAADGDALRYDRVCCTVHGWRGEKVKAAISRLLPEEQVGKRWSFEGRFEGNFLYGHFWSTDPKRTDSRGAIALYRVEDDFLEGHYTKVVYARTGGWELALRKYIWRRAGNE